jgi:acid phosphatase
VHDGDIVPVLAALRIMDGDDPLPITYIKHDRQWKTSRLTSMGGRIIFERLRCDGNFSLTGNAVFIRININDGVISVPGCDIGSGLCPLEQFVARLRKHEKDAGDFRELCGLGTHMPAGITFLHQ